MTNNCFVRLIIFAGLMILGCSKNATVSEEFTQKKQVSAAAESRGAQQISGVGFFATTNECDYVSRGADYAVRMTGDLEGCLYVFIDEFDCSPSGIYIEIGREHFVGTYKGEPGSFWTAYRFQSKYEGCAENSGPLGAEIFGRCQHPIVAGSGEGVFEGVTGRVDMKDDIEAGNFPIRGHLQW